MSLGDVELDGQALGCQLTTFPQSCMGYCSTNKLGTFRPSSTRWTSTSPAGSPSLVFGEEVSPGQCGSFEPGPLLYVDNMSIREFVGSVIRPFCIEVQINIPVIYVENGFVEEEVHHIFVLKYMPSLIVNVKHKSPMLERNGKCRFCCLKEKRAHT